MTTTTRLRIPEVRETAHLDGMHATVIGRYRASTVKPHKGGWVRETMGGHGRRTYWHATYAEATAAAMVWGNRASPVRAERGGLNV